MADLKESPSQTAGPYVHIGCVPRFAGLRDMYGGDPGAQMITGDAAGQRITLSGAVYDGAGAPVSDALIEIWQAGPDGQFGTTPGFTGWGRQACDPQTGQFRFETLMPGTVPGFAPHIAMWIVARGINLGLMTRVYFEQSAEDPVLRLARDRAETLIASPAPDGYRFDVHLQGPRETVFLDV